MGRYRKILVAVDGSESSKNAFRQACRISREDKSWITVVTTIPIYEDQFETLRSREKVSSILREEGERILSDIKRVAAEEDAFIRPRLEEGSPSETIIDIADEGNFDLIVMGRCGKTRLERALVGSVTARVIGYSQRDILVVPTGCSVEWETILLPTDGSRYSGYAAEKAIDLARSYNGNLETISVVDVPAEFYADAPKVAEDLIRQAKTYVEDVKKKAEEQGIGVKTYVREGEAYRIITDFAREEKVSLIVMGSHGKTGVRRLLMGSVAEKVIGYAPCPVLIVRG